MCLRTGDSDKNCPYNDFSKVTSTSVSANFIEFNDTINNIDNPIIFSAGGQLQEVSGGIDKGVEK